jgi:23S rRNA pseudouridine2605 synthase
MERLQKIIAGSGLVSRRQAEELIKEGRVIVNGKKITEMGVKVELDAKISVNGKPIQAAQSTTYVLYKPKGIICSTKKETGASIITDLVPKYPKVYPVGRLDKDSEGLILMSNDGDLTFKLTHPSKEHRKIYQLECKWQPDAKLLTETQIRQKLLKGVKLGDGLAKVDKLDILERHPEQVASFKAYFTVHEGRNHLLRRVCATIGLDVKRLKRISIQNLSLDKLKPGEYRLLSEREKQQLAL